MLESGIFAVWPAPYHSQQAEAKSSAVLWAGSSAPDLVPRRMGKEGRPGPPQRLNLTQGIFHHGAKNESAGFCCQVPANPALNG
jgi:hypothetical protein